jgi:branched-chain amino acid transport system permease protein
MGIDDARDRGCYAASTVLAGIAGIPIAPLFSVSADMGAVRHQGVRGRDPGRPRERAASCSRASVGVVEALIRPMLGSAYTNILAFCLSSLRWRPAARAARPRGGEESKTFRDPVPLALAALR